MFLLNSKVSKYSSYVIIHYCDCVHMCVRVNVRLCATSLIKQKTHFSFSSKHYR